MNTHSSPYAAPETSQFQTLTVEELQHPALRLAVNWWRFRRGARLFPAREDLNPRDIAGALAHMTLLRVIDGGADFEHRIVGDVQVQAYRVMLQGRRFSDIAYDAPELIDVSFKLLRPVVDSKLPYAFRGISGYDDPALNFTHSECVYLPLGQTDAAVDHIAAFSHYERRAVAL